MAKLRLSHSALSKYSMCPKSYEYHYVKRIRSNTTTGALLFGSALDLGLNSLLTKPNEDAYEVFLKAFTHVEINKEKYYLPTCTLVTYAAADYNIDLLVEDDFKEACKLVNKTLDYEKIITRKRYLGFHGISEEERIFYNYLNWLCLCRKASLMLSGYKKEILPKFSKIHEVQRKLSIKNDNGDEFVGYVDLIASMDGYGPIIFDNKTSARAYDEEDSVSNSQQLIIYTALLGPEYNTTKAGFIVMKKGLVKTKKCSKCGFDGDSSRAKTCDNLVEGKRCHGEWSSSLKADFQLIVDDIPEHKKDLVIDNINVLNKCISAELFPRNLNTCLNVFGQKCPYYSLCHSNSMTGLVEIPEEVKDENGGQ